MQRRSFALFLVVASSCVRPRLERSRLGASEESLWFQAARGFDLKLQSIWANRLSTQYSSRAHRNLPARCQEDSFNMLSKSATKNQGILRVCFHGAHTNVVVVSKGHVSAFEVPFTSSLLFSLTPTARNLTSLTARSLLRAFLEKNLLRTFPSGVVSYDSLGVCPTPRTDFWLGPVETDTMDSTLWNFPSLPFQDKCSRQVSKEVFLFRTKVVSSFGWFPEGSFKATIYNLARFWWLSGLFLTFCVSSCLAKGFLCPASIPWRFLGYFRGKSWRGSSIFHGLQTCAGDFHCTNFGKKKNSSSEKKSFDLDSLKSLELQDHWDCPCISAQYLGASAQVLRCKWEARPRAWCLPNERKITAFLL